MSSTDEKKPENMFDEPSENHETVENKHKKASERFLSFMKQTRADDKRKEEKEKREQEEKKAKAQKQESEITHFSNLFLKLTSYIALAFNKINEWLDIMLASSKRIRFLSLFITLLLCYFVNGGSGITTTKSIDYIDNVPVQVKCNNDYEVTGYDETVTLQLIGDYGSIQWAKVMKDYSVVIDVSNQTDGNYEVNYHVEGFANSLDVKVIPESTNVNISKKETRTFNLDYTYTSLDKLDEAYSLTEPELAILRVEVTAGKYTLDKISQVVAQIDVGNITDSIHDATAPIVALDSDGNVLNVSIQPQVVRYDMDVSIYSKVVPVELSTRGEVDASAILVSLTPSLNNVSIFGVESELAAIDKIIAYVDVEGLSSSTEIKDINLTLPDAITKVSNKTISVKATIEPKTEKLIQNIPISIESLPDGYSAKFISDGTTTIKVTGPKSKIDALNNTNLKVYVDLANAVSSTDSYELKIAGQDELITYEWPNGKTADIVVTRD